MSFVVDLHDDHAVDLAPTLFEQTVKRLGLCDRAREAVEDIAVGLAALVRTLGDQPDHERVGHKFAPPHDGARFTAELGARSNGRPEHVASGKLDQVAALEKQLGLRAFARARRPEQDQVHRRLVPLSRARLIRPSYWCARRWLWICATVSIVTLTTIRSEVPPK